MTEYYVYLDTEDKLPCFFPQFLYYCAYKNKEDLND